MSTTEGTDSYEKRFRKQAKWYEKHAEWNRWGYYGTRLSVLVFSGAIPVTVAVSGDSLRVTSIVAVLSFAVLVTEGASTLFRFNENWINYRITYEKLTREKAFFENGAGVYSRLEEGESAEHVFISRVERLLKEENTTWSQYAEDVGERPGTTPLGPAGPDVHRPE
jgi:hypothetical protein